MSEDVRNWLRGLGLDEYAEAFKDGAIEWDVLPELDHEILKELGVTAPGHRLKILKAAKAIEDVPLSSTPPDRTPSESTISAIFSPRITTAPGITAVGVTIRELRIELAVGGRHAPSPRRRVASIIPCGVSVGTKT